MSCEHKECKGNPYCFVKSQSKFYQEHCKKLDNCSDPVTGIWKDTMHVHQPLFLQFCGVGIHLRPDGTYCLVDTTG